MQWLKTLGPILWNFDSLSTSFTKDDRNVLLQGQQIQKQLSVKKQFSHTFKKRKHGLLMHLQLLEPTDAQLLSNTTGLGEARSQLEAVLQKISKGVWGALHPASQKNASSQNQIEGRNISCYWYRYPYFQKNEIENQIRELLKSNIIQPTTSPYSSPVLLVKKDGN